MCLHVKWIPTSRKDSIIKVVIKHLFINKDEYTTPYQYFKVGYDGILKSADSRYKINTGESVYGFHIHSYSIAYKSRSFHKAYAINIKAYGDRDLVSKFLYIPKADKTALRKSRVKKLEDIIRRPKITWKDIVKIFPEHIDSFKHNRYYNIDMRANKAQTNKRIKNMQTVNWSYMLKQENVSQSDLLAFASGQMSRRTFESLSTTARKIVRELGADEVRRRARKALSRLPV